MKLDEKRQERIARRDLRREPAFCEELARDLNVEQSPESFGRALDEICAELPDELPVTRYPLRSALRGLGAVAAALLLVCASLFGMNAVNPELAESLPGMGALFQKLNGTEPGPPEQNGVVPTVETAPSPQPEETALPRAPEFVPVTLEGTGEQAGTLTVTDARCDGEYLWLDLRLSGGDPALQNCKWIGTKFMEEEPGMTLSIDSTAVEASLYFSPEEDGSFAGSGVFELPSRTDDRREVPVELAVSTLYGQFKPTGIDEGIFYSGNGTGQPDVQNKPGFRGAFSVTAEPALRRSFSLDVSDNGTELLQVRQTLGEVLVELEIPFLGRHSYDLEDDVERVIHEAPFFGDLGGAIYSRPIGLNPYLHTEDGVSLPRLDSEEEYDIGVEMPEKGQAAAVLEDGPTRHEWRFTPAPVDTEKLVLTLYEYDSDGPYTDPDLGFQENPVLAEFTIDLARGTAEVTEQYRTQNLEKLDAEACREKVRHQEFTNGYYATRTYMWCTDDPACASRYAYHVILYGEDTAYRPVELRCYLNGELYATLPSCPPEEYNAEHYGKGYFQGEQGQYWEDVSDPAYTQREFRELVFNVYCPEWMAFNSSGEPEETERFRMDLVDSGTGKVLVEDVERTYWRQEGLEALYYGEHEIHDEPLDGGEQAGGDTGSSRMG